RDGAKYRDRVKTPGRAEAHQVLAAQRRQVQGRQHLAYGEPRAAIDRAVRNARLIFVQDFWHTTRIPASLARRTMSAVPRPPGSASTSSGLPSSSICWLRLGPPERPKSTR